MEKRGGSVCSYPVACAGQKVDLTARIREILLNYPEGTPILKELVQVSFTHSPFEEGRLHRAYFVLAECFYSDIGPAALLSYTSFTQNADDAKATTIRFCLDQRVHSSGKSWTRQSCTTSKWLIVGTAMPQQHHISLRDRKIVPVPCIALFIP
eukprot:scaffold199069_cov22-Tisochrysis_lutea.AAC.1